MANYAEISAKIQNRQLKAAKFIISFREKFYSVEGRKENKEFIRLESFLISLIKDSVICSSKFFIFHDKEIALVDKFASEILESGFKIEKIKGAYYLEPPKIF